MSHFFLAYEAMASSCVLQITLYSGERSQNCWSFSAEQPNRKNNFMLSYQKKDNAESTDIERSPALIPQCSTGIFSSWYLKIIFTIKLKYNFTIKIINLLKN